MWLLSPSHLLRGAPPGIWSFSFPTLWASPSLMRLEIRRVPLVIERLPQLWRASGTSLALQRDSREVSFTILLGQQPFYLFFFFFFFSLTPSTDVPVSHRDNSTGHVDHDF